MDLGRDGLEHEHDPVTSKDSPEVVCVSVASSLITNVESQLGLIERKRSAQVVDNKKGSNTIQHGESAVDAKTHQARPRTMVGNGNVWMRIDVTVAKTLYAQVYRLLACTADLPGRTPPPGGFWQRVRNRMKTSDLIS